MTRPGVVRLGAVGYLNARPHVFGLDRSPRFSLRYDIPSECARLLHAGDIDLGLIPSIEYLQNDAYRSVADVAVVSRGPVVSVAIFTTRPMRDVRSIAMDSSSRTSVALVRVLCARLFRIQPTIESHDPDLSGMLNRADAALVIGDNALIWTGQPPLGRARSGPEPVERPEKTEKIDKIDLGEAWTAMTGLPFVWAFWVGRAGAVTADDVGALSEARDEGVRQLDLVAREHFRDRPEYQELGVRYLRENIKYYLRDEERAGLELFYRYAAEVGAAPVARELRFY